LNPSPVTPCHTSRTPQLLVVHAYIHMSLQGVCLSSREFLSGVFVWKVLSGVVLSVPLLSEYIRYNRKLNITFKFRFHTYENSFKSVTSYALGPHTPVTNCHTFSHLLPLERDILFGGPIAYTAYFVYPVSLIYLLYLYTASFAYLPSGGLVRVRHDA